ncbi:chromodomain-helicase-DNA-binding protein 1-like [Pyrus ussuriensis x Pyrus communis]|uniref:Chromodomain-helicase-DNA-binding protein 1-like n=1 Tax=Pyrus ussuriensis x Pyrus communis TaxID=2448454 RepID=A0A5N5HWZ4_9ROSA|nr:chromodomain-helicase-DNA-binding protein 1-like [Pyrus ussuriensis x Pyrus communis]
MQRIWGGRSACTNLHLPYLRPLPPTMFYKSSSTRPIKDGASYEKDLRRSFSSGTNNMNKSNGEFQRSYVDSLSMSKSVRTTRAGKSAAGAWKVMEKSSKEVETSLVEKVEEKKHFLNKVGMESDEETEKEDDSFDENFIWKDIREIPKTTPNNYVSISGNVFDAEPDVDKKADEFIAKFREKIRLQRIDLIKRSSAQISKNLSR